VQVRVVTSDGLGGAERAALRGLWDNAFGDRFNDTDADHAYGGVHVLVLDGGRPVAHGSAVPRSIRFGEGPWREVAYVEAVATAPGLQGRGLGRTVVLRLHEEIDARWEVAMLSTGRATGFYERLGWTRWQGTSFTLRADGPAEDGEHGGLMVRGHRSAGIDVSGTVTCCDRSGDAW